MSPKDDPFLMKSIFKFLFILAVNSTVFCQSNSVELSEGKWKFQLIPNDSVTIPFFVEINKDHELNYHFTIINGKENIEVSTIKSEKDSLFIELPVFNSEFRIQVLDEFNLMGKWHNYAKGPSYAIPLTGTKTNQDRFHFKEEKKNSNFSGKYEVTFSKDDPWKSVGIFKQKGNKITGTFLTETGDFRFLEGNSHGDKIYLSCFDGSHAFSFNGKLINDTIHGFFYSGNHYYTNWVGFKNESYELTDADSLTKRIDDSKITFSLPDLDSNVFSFPNEKHKDKVTIIQIMGSWCPNCMDETKYYKELYEKYNQKGLEIIAIAFEAPKDFKAKTRMLKKLQNHFNIKYKILVGGDASKKLASEIFPNLNSIISFPTSIFIDKNNEVRRIHTGFNGPGTNKHYKEYVSKTKKLIETMLKE